MVFCADLIYAVVIESVFRSNVADGHIQADEFNYFLFKKMLLENWPVKIKPTPATHAASTLAHGILHSVEYLSISGGRVLVNLVSHYIIHSSYDNFHFPCWHVHISLRRNAQC